MFGIALTRPSLTMQLTSGIVCGQKADTSSNYCFSHMSRDVSVFVKCDTIFRLFFLEYNFRKVVRQHTEGMVVRVLLEIYFSFQQ